MREEHFVHTERGLLSTDHWITGHSPTATSASPLSLLPRVQVLKANDRNQCPLPQCPIRSLFASFAWMTIPMSGKWLDFSSGTLVIFARSEEHTSELQSLA